MGSVPRHFWGVVYFGLRFRVSIGGTVGLGLVYLMTGHWDTLSELVSNDRSLGTHSQS